MSYNRKAITDALSKMNKAKKPKQPKDIIKDPEGQYKYPGVPTRIPSDNITMQGVPYPLLGVDNLGNQQMMYPGAEYAFPGADYVDEFPMMQGGGQRQPIYVTNPKDPRLIAYQDSLKAYNAGLTLPSSWETSDLFYFNEKYANNKGQIKRTTLTKGDKLVYPTQYNDKGKRVNAWDNTSSNVKPYMIGRSTLYDKGKVVSPSGIDAIVEYPIYKKPQQPVQFKPDPEVVAKQEELIAAGYDIGEPDGIWGPKSEAAWIKYQNKVENQPTETSVQPNQTSGVPPLDVAPIDNPVATPQTLSSQGSQQPPNTPQQASAAPQQPSGYNVWTHNGQPLDPAVYGWAPSDSPRQISQFADTHSLKRANEAYTKLNATPWATEGNKLLTDLSKPYFTKTAATNVLAQTAEQLGVPVEQLEIVKAPAGYSGYVVIQNLPQQKYGGLVTGLTNTSGNLLMSEQGKRMMAQSGSLSATNKMFLGNPMVTKRKKSVFVPGAPFQEGGNTSDPGMDAMMKARFAYAHMHGNPAAQRMTYPVDNPYIFTGTEPYTNPDMAGEFGTHYMFSQDNYAVPTIQQDEYGNLIYNPAANYTNSEAIRFDSSEDATNFAKFYKLIAPGMQTGGSTDWKSRIASAMNFQKGGQMSREEFEKRKAAYKKLTGRDLTEKNVATIKQQQNLQKFIDDKKPLEKKLPTSEAEAMAMIESGELKIETIAQQQAREKREADAREADRIARLKAYEKRQADPNYGIGLTPLPGETWRDFWAAEGSNLDAVFRTSQEDNFFDDYINPLVWIGSMAKNLGESPQQAKQTGSLLPYITAVGTPLVMGAIGGTGATNTGQFVNNLVNPVAGLGTGMLNRFGRRSFTPYLDDIGSSLNPRTVSNTPRQLPGSSNVAPAVNTTPAPWTMQEMPGLHLKSTMLDNPKGLHTTVAKDGTINTENALKFIKNNEGQAKYDEIIKGFGDNIPKKMDYNEFRKVVQDQLIPLERQFATHSSDYGIERLGYGDVNFNTSRSGNKTIHMLESDIIENQTLILSNKGKFGRGSSAHGNPEETLGHIHFLRDAETPDVLTVTQIQSDAFQGTHRIMPKTFNKEQELRALSMMEDNLKAKELDYSKAKKLPNGDYKFDDGLVMDKTLYEQRLTVQREMNAMKKAHIENFTQKQLLDKNHQERYLQELVNYAGERGDINKIRVPTSETAAKVQGYRPVSELNKSEEFIKLRTDIVDALEKYGNNSMQYKKANEVYEQAVKNSKHSYSSEHQTILKKYAEQPKIIKKLFGVEPKVVKDSKGNTWYEFNIPEKFKKGKGEIKAFNWAIPATIATGAAASQYKQGGSIQPLDYFDTELTDQEIEQYKKGGCVVVKL